MRHSDRFERVRDFYDSGSWDVKKVREAVEKEWITKDEFRIITGHDF